MRTSTGKIGSGICVLLATFLAIWFLPKSSIFPGTAYGPVLHEEISSYSNIRVRGSDKKRHLLFVAGNGREGLQSSIDLDNPGQLQVPYTRALFASFLFRHPQERVLIVGLGGGGMVRFIDHRLPETKVEVIEIDPVVVSLADKYFGTRQTPRVTIHTEDAFLFFRRNTSQFDVIYMDAFLKPSVDRKADSETARLKTVSFLKTIKYQLAPGGVLACNLITHRKETKADLVALREVFPLVKTMKVAGTGNLAVFATEHVVKRSRQDWIALGKSLEKSLPVGIPFSDYAAKLK